MKWLRCGSAESVEGEQEGSRVSCDHTGWVEHDLWLAFGACRFKLRFYLPTMLRKSQEGMIQEGMNTMCGWLLAPVEQKLRYKYHQQLKHGHFVPPAERSIRK
jgi:hypothetical protein